MSAFETMKFVFTFSLILYAFCVIGFITHVYGVKSAARIVGQLAIFAGLSYIIAKAIL